MNLHPKNILPAILLLVAACATNPEAPYLEGADYDPGSRTLTVPYESNPDTSLYQVIAVSGSRGWGYGGLIGIDSTAAGRDLEKVLYRFKKLDINAVHIFHAAGSGMIDGKTRAAIEGARFTWVFASDPGWQENTEGSALAASLGHSLGAGGILVISR